MDNQNSGRFSTTNNDENLVKVKTLLVSDRRLSVQLIFEQLNLPKTNVVTGTLRMRKVNAKLVQKVLTDERKDRLVNMCQEIFD